MTQKEIDAISSYEYLKSIDLCRAGDLTDKILELELDFFFGDYDKEKWTENWQKHLLNKFLIWHRKKIRYKYLTRNIFYDTFLYMKKNKFFIGLIIYFSVYFIFSFILDSSIEYAFINDNDRQILKEEFNQLEETDILFVYRDQARFKPILVVVYRDNQTGEKHHSNILIKSERPKIENLADKISDNDIIKYFWYFNFINLAILLIAYNIIKRKTVKTKK